MDVVLSIIIALAVVVLTLTWWCRWLAQEVAGNKVQQQRNDENNYQQNNQQNNQVDSTDDDDLECEDTTNLNIFKNTEEDQRRMCVDLLEQLKAGLNEETCRVQLVGYFGSGKSTFINSAASALKGRICVSEPTSEQNESVTTRYSCMKLDQINLEIYDMAGLSPLSAEFVYNVKLAIDGRVKLNHKFDRNRRIERDEECQPDEINEKHVVLMVIDGHKYKDLSEDNKEQLRCVLKHCRDKNITHMVLLSKVDKISPVISDSNQDLIHFNKVFKSTKVSKLMTTISSELGVQKSLIYPIAHYTTCRTNDIYNDTYILHILSEIKNRGEDYRISHQRVILPSEINLPHQIAPILNSF